MASGLAVLALVGKDNPGLLGSYARAYESLGCRVSYWDPHAALARHTKFGRLGRFATNFVPVDAWILKANRELIVLATELTPDLLLVSGNAPIRSGTLAQIRIIVPEARLALLWPDTLLNLTRHVIESLPIYDLVATYSSASIDSFQRLGAKRVEWFPFAADQYLFPVEVAVTEDERRHFACDVCFIGNHNPEREKAIVALLGAGFSVKVWGEPRSWRRHAREKATLGRYYQGRPLFGADFAKAIRSAKLSLNVIDPTNFPAANMRFFESPASGGATLNSRCPEMADVFRDRQHAFYYEAAADLPAVARSLVADEPLRASVAAAGHELVLREHTYVHRAQRLSSALSLGG